MILDQVIVVDKWDRKLGVMDKVEAHRGRGVLHRAVSVFLFNKHGEVLLQQRSHKKIVGALQWANTCCGNVRPNETYLQCAKRRLKEELGIERVKLKRVCKFEYQAFCNEKFSEHEMDTVYVGRYDAEVRPNPDEVKDYIWINWKAFVERIHSAKENDEFILAPWTKILLNLEEVKNIA